MKNRILSVALTMFLLVAAFPGQAVASETEADKLISLLNSKAGKFTYDKENRNPVTGVLSRDEYTNTYIFSRQGKMLQIEFVEATSFFENQTPSGKVIFAGKVLIDPEGIDLGRFKTYKGWLDIVCRDNANCMNREDRDMEYNEKGEKISETVRQDETWRVQLRGADQPLDAEIIKDLTALFSLLVPAAEPEDKPGEKTGETAADKPAEQK